jgi:hypothetical protein
MSLVEHDCRSTSLPPSQKSSGFNADPRDVTIVPSLF